MCIYTFFFLKSQSMQCENFMYVIEKTKNWFLHLRFNHNCKSITNVKSPPAEGVFLSVLFKGSGVYTTVFCAFWACWLISNRLDKSTEMSSTFRTLRFDGNGQQTEGLLVATQSERLINLFLGAIEFVCTKYEGKQIWLVWLLTELSFEVNFPDIEDLQLRMLKRKWCSQEELWKKEAEAVSQASKFRSYWKWKRKWWELSQRRKQNI